MPAAAKLLADTNLSAADVAGTGRDGRVTKGDVLGALATVRRRPQSLPRQHSHRRADASRCPKWRRLPAKADLGDRPEQRVPMSRLRARIAERLLQSQVDQRHPDHVQRSEHGPGDGNAQEVPGRVHQGARRQDWLHELLRQGGGACAQEVPGHQRLRSTATTSSTTATSTSVSPWARPRGLVVPILRNADQMSFADIEKKIAEFGQKAKDGKLGIEEMTGGTFSISNGGTFGSMLSTPIINPPQSAILGVHATKDRAVVENGQIVIRPMNYLALSLRPPHHRRPRSRAGSGGDEGCAGRPVASAV